MNLRLKLLPGTLIVVIYLGTVFSNGLGFIEMQNQKENILYLKTFNQQENRKVLINAPIVSQKPELYNGCETCSLTMLLQYAGIKVNKMTLAEQIRKDRTPLILDRKGNIVNWGNPDEGFVGDITGRRMGYGVYPGPMIELLEKYLPGKSVNLTGQSFDRILSSIDKKRPVIMWVTIDFSPASNFRCWEKDGRTIKATFKEHAVLLVGYDKDYCYINNPYNGLKNQKVRREVFLRSWNSMGRMAISYR